MCVVVDRKARFVWHTGCLLTIADLTFWLTARHVIEYMWELQNSAAVKVVSTKWMDPGADPELHHVPTDIHDLPAYCDPDLDFGALLIRPGYAAPLLASPNVIPLTPEVWWHQETARPEGYYVVGMPAEWAEHLEVGRPPGGRQYRASAALVCNPVERLRRRRPREKGDFWDHPGKFYARVLEVQDEKGRPLKSIEGMSGGPILSIERTDEGRFLYRLVGIQSSWLPESRILRGEPIEEVVRIIASWFEVNGDDTGEPSP